MDTLRTNHLVHHVHKALKRYHRPAELEVLDAWQWPAVQELRFQNINGVVAIRRTLDQALADLEATSSDGVGLLREHYVQGKSIEALALDYNMDPSNIHRRRRRLLSELALRVEDINRTAKRRIAARLLSVRHPVFGFEGLVDDVMTALQDMSGPYVVVIEGMGGLGKSTLARLVAHSFVESDEFAGVVWTSAKHIDFDVWNGKQRAVQPMPSKVSDLVYQLARALGMDTTRDHASLRADVIAQCKRHMYLIIIDNLESVSDTVIMSPLISDLVGPSKVLLTTRDRAHEALPTHLTRLYLSLNELDAPTSYKLLHMAAQYTDAPLLTTASEAELAHVFRVTGGNPLALWLVAGQAHNVPWSHFIHDLVAQCPPGTTGYELFDYLYHRSWSVLSPSARQLLFVMHRFGSGVEYTLLQKVCRLEQAAAINAIEELRSRMLLLFDGYHYSIHRLTYAFLRSSVLGWW